MRLFLTILLSLIVLPAICQYHPPAGQAGTSAVHKDSSLFVSWADNVSVNISWVNISDTTLGLATHGSALDAKAKADGLVVSLGDGGTATFTCNPKVINGSGWDFAVFENSFNDVFLELAFVEVSSDGINYFRFPSHSLTDTVTQIAGFGTLDATKINNLAGKYRIDYGTPFDLEELKNTPGLDIDNISHIRIVDVVGSIDPEFGNYDSYGNIINDPFPTPFASSGFDLDALGFINLKPIGTESLETTNTINIYPNPTANTVFFTNEVSEVEVMNFSGQKVMESGRTTKLDVSTLTEGIYIIKAVLDNGQILSDKLIIKRL